MAKSCIQNDTRFHKLVDEWEHGETVVAETVVNGVVIRVTQRDHFQVRRFFPIAGKWHVSEDISEATAPDVIKHFASLLMSP